MKYRWCNIDNSDIKCVFWKITKLDLILKKREDEKIFVDNSLTLIKRKQSFYNRPIICTTFNAWLDLKVETSRSVFWCIVFNSTFDSVKIRKKMVFLPCCSIDRFQWILIFNKTSVTVLQSAYRNYHNYLEFMRET